MLLVTGGSRGIGAATALLAARRGYAVAVNYTANSLAADEVVRAIRAGGGTAITVQADVGDEAQVLAMFAKVDAKLGRLTALVNNAGVVDMQARVDQMSVARLDRMMRINVIGSFVCAREAVRRMSTKHGGTGARSSTCRARHRASARRASTSTMRRARARSTCSPSASPRKWPTKAFA